MADGTLKVGTITTSSGSGTITIGQSGETVTIPSGATINMSSATQTGVGGANTPAFKAYYNGAQTISNNTATKITQYGTEEYDTDNAFASSRFTCPTDKGGRYIFFASLSSDVSSADASNQFTMSIKKGSTEIGMSSYLRNPYPQIQTFAVDTLSAGDYVEVFFYQNSGSSISLDGNERVFFSGFRLIE